MATENIVSKTYRVLTDASARVWDKISFWTKSSDVYNDSGNNLETTCGTITGITSSLTSTSTTMAASASAIKELNDKIADLSSNLSKSNYFVTSDRSFKISKTTKKVLIIWWVNPTMLMEELDLTNMSSWNRISIKNGTSVTNTIHDNSNYWTYENDTITLLSLVNTGYKMFVIEL